MPGNVNPTQAEALTMVADGFGGAQAPKLVTALAPGIDYEKTSEIAHHAIDHDPNLKAPALELGFVSEEEFDRVVEPYVVGI